MGIPDCYDPVYQEERRQLAFAARIKRRPMCLCCQKHIHSERYLDLEPFGLNGYACEDCVSRHMGDTDYLEELL